MNQPTPAELESVAMRMVFELEVLLFSTNVSSNPKLCWHRLDEQHKQFWLSYALRWHYGIEPKEGGDVQ